MCTRKSSSKAQTPLVRFVTDLLYNTVSSQQIHNTNRWSLSLNQQFTVERICGTDELLNEKLMLEITTVYKMYDRCNYNCDANN